MSAISYLNHVFHQPNLILDIQDISKLQKYSFTKDKKILDSKSVDENKNKENKSKEQKTKPEELKELDNVEKLDVKPTNTKIMDKDLIYVKQDDTLFWCLFIMHYGMAEYHNISRNYGVKELEEKKSVYEFVKKNQVFVKNGNYKITNVAIKEILSELITVQKKMSFYCLIALLAYYKKNLLVIDHANTSMLEFWVDKDMIPTSMDFAGELLPTYILYRDEKGRYKLQYENVGVAKILELRSTHYVWERFDKPLNGVSSYKVDEIKEICKKVGVDTTNKKYTKTELYQAIQVKIGTAFT